MREQRWRPREQHEKRQERWLLTYSDLITLLLILFVVFYAMSSIDESKYERVAQALQFELSDGEAPLDQSPIAADKQPNQPQQSTANDEESELDLELLKEQERALKQSLQALQTFISKNKLEKHITLKNTPRGIAITLKDLFLFDVGRSDLKTNAYPLLDELAKVFTVLENKVSIEGHTDNQPLFTGSIYQDNWGLSNARSLSVLRYFIYEKGLDPQMMVSTGYADTMPVANNNSSANRAKNRRVELVILR